jgi:hypothetical protein
LAACSERRINAEMLNFEASGDRSSSARIEPPLVQFRSADCKKLGNDGRLYVHVSGCTENKNLYLAGHFAYSKISDEGLYQWTVTRASCPTYSFFVMFSSITLK